VPADEETPDLLGSSPPGRIRKYLPAAGIIAVVVLIGIIAVAGIMTGMLPGIGQANATAPATLTGEQAVSTSVPTPEITPSPTPEITTVPTTASTSTTPEAAGANTTETVPVNASVTVTRNATANSTANVTANVTPTATKPLSNLDASKTFGIGETATDGTGKLTLNGYSLAEKLGDPIPSYAIGKKYLILNITFSNLQQNATTEVDLKGMSVRDAGGFTFVQVTDDPVLENPFYLTGKTVPPLENRTGNMAFVIAPDATFLKFEYDFGNQKIAVFQLPQYL
jgi:hypothetical protein